MSASISTSLILSAFLLPLLLSLTRAQSLTQPGCGRGKSSLPGDYNHAFADHPIRSVVASAPVRGPVQYSYNPRPAQGALPVRCEYKPPQPHYHDGTGLQGYGAPCGYQSRCEGNGRVGDAEYYGTCGQCGGTINGGGNGGRGGYQLPRYDGSRYADGSNGFGKNLVAAPKMAQKPQVTTVDPYADGFLMPEVVSTELKPKMREVDDGVKTEYEGTGVKKLKGKIKGAMGKEASKGALQKSRDGRGRRMGL